jgi:hypothetical protein
MKIIKLKAKDKRSYYKHYLTLVLKPFYNLLDSDVSILLEMYMALEDELANGVPLEASMRLISSTEYRNDIMSRVRVISRKQGNQENEITKPIFTKELVKLRKYGILDGNFALTKRQMIDIEDEGFGFKVILEDGE